MSIINLSISQLKEIIAVKEQIISLEAQLAKILGGKSPVAAKTEVTAVPAKKGRKKMSAAGKAKIAAAQKARWAKVKGTAVVKAAPVAKVAVVAAPAKKAKRVLSPEGRAKIVAALKKRWAAKKK